MKKIETQYLISAVAFLSLGSLFWYALQYGWLWFIISYVYYKLVVGLLGNQIAQHRYFSHRSFQTSAKKEWILYFVSLTTGVNPVFYALAHRHHHRYSDQPQDLHSIFNHWSDILSPLTGKTSYQGEIEITRVLSAKLRKINHVWPWIFLLYVIIGAILDWRFAVFAVAAGPAWNYTHMILFRVWFVHVKLPGSYRNYNTNDYSWNNRWIQMLDIGEGLHNNHHKYPGLYNQAILPKEFDPTAWVIDKFFIQTKT